MKRNNLGAWWVSVLLGIWVPVVSQAAVTPHGLFCDGAVLQQGMEVPVWGSARDGEKVTVKILNQEASTIAKGGRWLVKLRPMTAGGPYTMTIAGENTIELKNILVGEVWLCAGQSNMAFQLLGATHGKEAIAAAADPYLHLATVPTARGDSPQVDLGDRPGLVWHEAGPYAGSFSAVGYFFGRDLRKALNVPVGLLHASVGATAALWWMNEQAFAAEPKARPAIETESPKNPNISVLYNGMIAPLEPYAIRGVIWYQGESDSNHPELYRTMFPALIRGWREAWGEGDFPFLFAQAAPNDRWPPELREAQLISWQKTTNTGMAVTTDCGDKTEIHPPNKEPVGARLALIARAVAYEEQIEYSGPIYESMKITGNRITLSFKHTGSGLESHGAELKGFTIAGADGQFVPATAKIEGTRVIVSSPQVPTPVAVRYGWECTPDVNLYNKEGLPASPFRTDSPVKLSPIK